MSADDSSAKGNPLLQIAGDAQARRAIRLTWLTWVVFFVAVSCVIFWKDTRKPVNNAYAEGAERWMARTDLYERGGGGFIYFPQSAIVYSPFRMLPFAAEQFTWRLLSVSLFALGIFRLSRLIDGAGVAQIFPLTTWLVLPKAWNCACNGQATLVMTGLSMLALAEIPARRWWRSAALAVAALAFKPLALVLIMLIAVLHRPLFGRIIVGLSLFGLVPYAFRDVAYVNAQYAAMVTMLDEAAHLGLDLTWAQLFSLCSLVGVQVPAQSQTWLRLVTAAGTLALCLRACRADAAAGDPGSSAPKQQNSRMPGWLAVLALSTAYLLLFNPRTENNTYVMLSPVLGFLCARAYAVERRKTRGALLAAAATAIVVGHELCGWLTPHAGFIWVCPLVCLIFTVDLVLGVIRRPIFSPVRAGLEPNQGAQRSAIPAPVAQHPATGDFSRAA